MRSDDANAYITTAQLAAMAAAFDGTRVPPEHAFSCVVDGITIQVSGVLVDDVALTDGGTVYVRAPKDGETLGDVLGQVTQVKRMPPAPPWKRGPLVEPSIGVDHPLYWTLAPPPPPCEGPPHDNGRCVIIHEPETNR